MLANKYHESGRVAAPVDVDKPWLKKLFHFDPEDVIENITGVMFKGILFLGIPYFLFVFIKFLLIH